MKYPLETSIADERDAAFCVLTQKYAIHASALLNERNTAFLNTLLDFHFLFLWMNKDTIADYALKFLFGFNDEVLKHTLNYAIAFLVFSVAIVVISFALVIFFCGMTREFDEIRGKILKLFKRVPKETANEIFENLFRQSNQETNGSGNGDINRLLIPNTCIILGCLLVVFICVIVSVIVFVYQTMTVVYNDNSARDLMVCSHIFSIQIHE